MISRKINKNKFGGHTWEFNLYSLLHVFINETDTGVFVVDFKEWKFFNYKTHFSFVSKNDLKSTISEALDRIYEFMLTNPKYNFSFQQKEGKLNEILQFIELYDLDNEI